MAVEMIGGPAIADPLAKLAGALARSTIETT